MELKFIKMDCKRVILYLIVTFIGITLLLLSYYYHSDFVYDTIYNRYINSLLNTTNTKNGQKSNLSTVTQPLQSPPTSTKNYVQRSEVISEVKRVTWSTQTFTKEKKYKPNRNKTKVAELDEWKGK